MQIIDARGRSCPEPVMLTRAALLKENQGAEVLVDNLCAVENITRLAAHMGYKVERKQRGADYAMLLSKS